MGRRISAIDVAAGVTGRAVRATEVTASRVRPVVEPVARIALHPPLLSERFQPWRWLDSMAQEGAGHRAMVAGTLSRWSDVVVPALVEELLRRVNLTDLLLQYVDLDAVVSAVDLDAAAGRLDVEAVVHRVDLDKVVGRVDVDAIVDRVDVESVVNRVDVDAVVNRVDLDAAVTRIDLDAAARQLDLDGVLDRMDLTSLVLQRVDLDVLIQAVLDRIDLLELAEKVIDGVDLPEIIRESTGSMASDTVRGVRMQGIVADEAVGRAVDRLLLRRRRRSTDAPSPPSSPAEQDEPVVPSQRDLRR
jgi:hypothetical protein